MMGAPRPPAPPMAPGPHATDQLQPPAEHAASGARLEGVLGAELHMAMPHLVQAERGRLYDTVLARLERPLLTLALARTGGNQLHAARLLGIHRNTLRRRLGALGMAAGRGRAARADLAPGSFGLTRGRAGSGERVMGRIIVPSRRERSEPAGAILQAWTAARLGDG